MPSDHVIKTISALQQLGVDKRDASRLLDMYAGRHEMSADEIEQVLNELPVRKERSRGTTRLRH